VIHAEGDGLSGLIVDKFGDVLVVEAFSLGMYQRAEALLDLLSPLCGTVHGVLRCAPLSEEHEGFATDPIGSEDVPPKVTITEFGTRFKIDFTEGHKTGFYCDQRENRQRLAGMVAGKSVLDVCSYTGGFALQAKVLGHAAEVTGVELDEAACELARENARLNKAKIQFVQGDGFPYLRDMHRNGRLYDVLVLDPPKLIRHRDEEEEGKTKYFDFNRLALKLVAPGGLYLTCSCSGLLDAATFTQLVTAAANAEQRRIQIFSRAGAASDHPVGGNCPESEYLKTLWIRVE
jgi:23S rRNA (cytosine1962-C5)-methyltransferase